PRRTPRRDAGRLSRPALGRGARRRRGLPGACSASRGSLRTLPGPHRAFRDQPARTALARRLFRNRQVAATGRRSMLGHISFGVNDLAKSTAFYDAALAELGYMRVWSGPTGVGYGRAGQNDKLALFARPG